MYLCSNPAPTFYTCDRKIFHKSEYHVTRRYSRSVLILMLGGILRFREDGKDIELRVGEYYIQRDGLLQEGVLLGDLPEYFYIEFYGTYSEEVRGGIALRGKFRREVLLPLMEECVSSFYGQKPSLFYLNSVLSRVLDILLTEASDANEHFRIAARLKDYLESNYPSDLSMHMLSQKFGYSENHLNRVFRAAYGVTPHRFLSGVRIAKAHWLLLNTDVPVNRVSEMVGYSDPSVFYRGFIKMYGVSPRTVREGSDIKSAENVKSIEESLREDNTQAE